MEFIASDNIESKNKILKLMKSAQSIFDQDTVSCLGKINHQSEDKKAVTLLIAGTEQKKIYIFEKSATLIKNTVYPIQIFVTF